MISVIEGQVSIFDFPVITHKEEFKKVIEIDKNANDEIINKCETKEKKITDMQQKTIDKVLRENTGTEVFFRESGVVAVIADYDPKVIVPQGDISKAFKPNETRKTYLIREDGQILAIAIGEMREGKRIICNYS